MQEDFTVVILEKRGSDNRRTKGGCSPKSVTFNATRMGAGERHGCSGRAMAVGGERSMTYKTRAVGGEKKMQCGRGQGRSDLAEQGNICALVLAGFSLNVCYVSIGRNY